MGAADDAVDGLRDQISRELLTFMMEDVRTIPRAGPESDLTGRRAFWSVRTDRHWHRKFRGAVWSEER